jgi:hypothetical protein
LSAVVDAPESSGGALVWDCGRPTELCAGADEHAQRATRAARNKETARAGRNEQPTRGLSLLAN